MTVTDESMKLPENWQTKTSHIPGPGEKAIGHEEQGTTIALHSLAVRREYQGKGMGSTVLREFLQRMDNAKTAERVAIISHEHLIKYYEKIGFKNMGPSKAQFGGGGWFDLVSLQEVTIFIPSIIHTNRMTRFSSSVAWMTSSFNTSQSHAVTSFFLLHYRTQRRGYHLY